MANRLRPSLLIRSGLAIGILFLTVVALWVVLILTDTAFSVWEHLKETSPWFLAVYGIAFFGISAVGGWALWRLFRPTWRRAREKKTRAAPLDRAALEKRLTRADEAGIDIETARRELALLQQRKAAGTIYVSFFGEISSGKSSLIKALLPETEIEISAVGGTTRAITSYRWQSPSGDALILLDMPGTNEVGAGLDDMARTEALRSHLVVYVCDGDLSRSQYEELQGLLALDKPMILAVNKMDRYRREELERILERLAERLNPVGRLDIIPVQAGGAREVLRIGPDGREETVVRNMPPRVEPLKACLQQRLDEDPEVLEKLRDTSVFVLVSNQLDEAERVHRRSRVDELTRDYSKKAMIGALAAVAPGSDLVIQGYLGIAMVKAIAKLYEVPVRGLDTDLLLELVQKRVARTTTVMLAVAGNALKAFPGAGTLLGGITHAAAYGMIFEALGKAVAQSFESRGALRPAQAAQAFEENLREDLEARARRFARLALEIHRENPGTDRGGSGTDTAAR